MVSLSFWCVIVKLCHNTRLGRMSKSFSQITFSDCLLAALASIFSYFYFVRQIVVVRLNSAVQPITSKPELGKPFDDFKVVNPTKCARVSPKKKEIYISIDRRETISWLDDNWM